MYLIIKLRLAMAKEIGKRERHKKAHQGDGLKIVSKVRLATI